jgi:drug/metabolite transporter (DMT)-like permease
MSFALGIIAAIAAPFLMVLGFIVWDNHWTGSAFALNMYKCTLAGLGFAVIAVVARETDEIFPRDVFTPEAVGALVLSSTVGILIGDWTWLEGMRLLGSRKVIIMDSLKPFLAVLLGRIVLGEKLQRAAFVGLVLTVVGVSLVGFEKEEAGPDDVDLLPGGDVETSVLNESSTLIEEKRENKKTTERLDSYAERRRQRKPPLKEIQHGFFWSVSNVLLHTFGALLTKTYAGGMTTWEINFIRFGFAGLCMLLLSFFMRLRRVLSGSGTFSGTDGAGTKTEEWYELPTIKGSWWIQVSVGVFFVSFLHPALTNYAMFQIALALLLTLESIGPLYSLPLSYILENEKPTYRACLGALLAVVGIVLLSFRGTVD